MTSLVAGPRDIPQSAFAGTGLLEDIDSTCKSLVDGDWVAASLGVVGVGMSTLAAVADPIGTALSAGIGWLIEHLNPLKEWLQNLTGDESAVAGFADTWINISQYIQEIAEDVRLRMDDLADMSGGFVDALRAQLSTSFDAASSLASVSSAVGVGFEVASSLVAMVYGLVRDALADIIAKAVVWVAEVVLSLGLGTPVVVAQVVTTVGDWAANLFPKLRGLVDSVESVQELARTAERSIGKIAENLSARVGTAGAADATASAATALATRASENIVVHPRIMDNLFNTRTPPEIVDVLAVVVKANTNFGDSMGGLITSLTSVGRVRSTIAMLWSDGQSESAQQLQSVLDDYENRLDAHG